MTPITRRQAAEVLTQLERTTQLSFPDARALIQGTDVHGGVDAAAFLKTVFDAAPSRTAELRTVLANHAGNSAADERAAFATLVDSLRGRGMAADPIAAATSTTGVDSADALTEGELAAMRSVLGPSTALQAAGKSNHAFKDWVTDQVTSNPATHATFTGLADLLVSARRPQTVADVISATIGIAREQVSKLPNAPTSERARMHMATATAMLALAAHGMFCVPGHQAQSFPQFLPDGRVQDYGHDKSRHCVDHAMFSFITLYDQLYGDGTHADGLLGQVDKIDTQGWGAAVGQAYDDARGTLGALLKGYQPAPPEDVSVYFPRPDGLNPTEAKAYDYAVRVGDYYEAASTDGFSLDKLGREPVAGGLPLDSTEGLSDPGTTRDMTANRIGAWIGTQLFRDPSAVPPVPFDTGRELPGVATW